MMDDTLYDGTGLAPEGDAQQQLTVPDGTLEDHLIWVREGDDTDQRIARADAVYLHAEAADETVDLSALSSELTAAVYGITGSTDGSSADDRTPSEVEADKNAEGNSGDIASGAYVEGTTVESDTAGTGEAVNAETGETTQPGQPLPPIEGGDGQPLEPATDTPTDAEQPEQPTP